MIPKLWRTLSLTSVNGTEVFDEEAAKFDILNRQNWCDPESRISLGETILSYENIPKDLQLLVEGEKELLSPNRPFSTMEGLRKRIYKKWFEFIHSAFCNNLCVCMCKFLV